MTTLEITYNGCDNKENAFYQYISWYLYINGEIVDTEDSMFTVQKFSDEAKFEKAYNMELLLKASRLRDNMMDKWWATNGKITVKLTGLVKEDTKDLMEQILN